MQWHLLSFCCDRWQARLSRAPSMASVNSFSRKFSRYSICRVDFWHLLPSLPLNAGGKFPLCCPSTSSAHKNKINKSNETLQVCLSRALRMVMPTIALLVSVRLTWHFLVVGVWVLLSPVHAFSLAIPTKVAFVAIAITPESSDRGIELLRERLGKAVDEAYFQSFNRCQSNLRCAVDRRTS